MGWIGCRCNAHRKQVDVKQWYNPGPQRSSLSLLQFEAVRTRPSRELGLQGPQLSSLAERERNAAKDKGTGGQYVTVFVQSPTHLSHITLSQPFRIKCEGFIFLKKLVRSSLLCWLCFCMYMWIVVYALYGYATLSAKQGGIKHHF